MAVFTDRRGAVPEMFYPLQTYAGSNLGVVFRGAVAMVCVGGDDSKIWSVGLRPQMRFRISSEGLWVWVAALVGVKLQT